MSQVEAKAAPFDTVCSLLTDMLGGHARARILNAARTKQDRAVLMRLRNGMHSDRFEAEGGRIDLSGMLRSLDENTKSAGFNVRRDWDGKADKLNENTIPVDLLDYFINLKEKPLAPAAPAILLDYYFLYILAELALTAWESGDAAANLDRVNRLIALLQGPNGSGHRFLTDAETLIIAATSHFEPDTTAYDRLLARIGSLNHAHRLAFARAEAAVLGSHLRYGFDYFYGRDLGRMRDDNAPDYGWLCFSLLTLMREYDRCPGPGRDAEALVNGLSTDTRAFLGTPPPSLQPYRDNVAEFGLLFRKNFESLMRDFEPHRPSEARYSPMALGFNFPHNIIKGLALDAAAHGQPASTTLNDLLTGVVGAGEPESPEREAAARTIFLYARAAPDTVRGRPVPSVIYDPAAGRRDFSKTISLARELAG